MNFERGMSKPAHLLLAYILIMCSLWGISSCEVISCCALWLFEVGGNGEIPYHGAVATIVCQVGSEGVYLEQSGST